MQGTFFETLQQFHTRRSTYRTFPARSECLRHPPGGRARPWALVSYSVVDFNFNLKHKTKIDVVTPTMTYTVTVRPFKYKTVHEKAFWRYDDERYLELSCTSRYHYHNDTVHILRNLNGTFARSRNFVAMDRRGLRSWVRTVFVGSTMVVVL